MNLITKEEIKQSWITPHSLTSSHELALVYVNPSGQYEAFINGAKIKPMHLRFGKYTAVYKVDMRRQTYHQVAEFDSNNSFDKFLVDVTLFYSINDPKVVIQKGTQNPQQILELSLKEAIRKIAKQYSIEMTGDVEDDIKTLILDPTLAAKFSQEGFKIEEIYANVSLGRETKQRLDEERQVDIDTKMKIKKIRSDKEVNKTLTEDVDVNNKLDLLIKSAKSPEDLANKVFEYSNYQKGRFEDMIDLIGKTKNSGLNMDEVMEYVNQINGVTKEAAPSSQNKENSKKLDAKDKFKKRLAEAESNDD